jgi:hypothetical protein
MTMSTAAYRAGPSACRPVTRSISPSAITWRRKRSSTMVSPWAATFHPYRHCRARVPRLADQPSSAPVKGAVSVSRSGIRCSICRKHPGGEGASAGGLHSGLVLCP